MMVEPALLQAFSRGRIDLKDFHHADHVRVAFDLLQVQDFSTALCRFRAGLKTMAARSGDPGAYRETTTLAFLALIAERRETGRFDTADDFVRGDPDVLDRTILRRWYSPERLNSDLARRIFILPEALR